MIVIDYIYRVGNKLPTLPGSRTLTENRYFNGHPDLLVKGKYPSNSVKAGEHGIEKRRLAKLEAP